jgi:DNA polymerase III delta prime subunit
MEASMKPDAIIWTEGKTDWQHLKRAFEILGTRSRIVFKESESDMGDDQLLKQCVALSRDEQACPTIFVFDRDKEDVIAKVEDPNKGFKDWGNRVFSFAIPIPPHRMGQRGICIESYYADEDLRIEDSSGRRLYLASEFSGNSGRHLADPTLSVGNKGKLPQRDVFKVIDTDVYNDRGENVALSKADFAINISAGSGEFGRVQSKEFAQIAALIDKIVIETSALNDLCFGGFEVFSNELAQLDPGQQVAAIIEAAIKACKVAAMTFSAATLRHYEQRIVDAKSADAKKVRPIRQLLFDNFAHPSLAVLAELCRHCYYLINEDAPAALFTLRAVMAQTPALGDFGQLLDDLERLLPPPPRKGRSVSRSKLKKPLLDYVFRELATYEDRFEEAAQAAIKSAWVTSASFEIWLKGLSVLLKLFDSLNALPFRVRNLERVSSDTNEFLVLLTNYRDGRITLEEQRQAYTELDSDQLERYELLAGAESLDLPLDLYPFVIIKGDRLYYYTRTTPVGYEYTSVFGTTSQLLSTKRKFSHAALRTTVAADLQKLFWAQVTPTISSSGVKTNIPARDAIVGRKHQIDAVMDEIVQIPNQNGIIYGPGGVGKTALLLELSRQLMDTNPVVFDHIVWISAKRDYYDPLLDTVEPGTPQFECLDNVLTSILEFHEIEDPTGYKREDQKWLVVECFRDQKTLLIIDNFESVVASAQEEILRFFNLDVKRALRGKPDYFKLIVTSRERIPSGLHQISLKGLDKDESKELMQRLYEPYRRSGLTRLTEEQLDALYDATRGIPLMIKHCYGQVFEYGRPVESVIKRLSGAPNRVVEFSFSEIFKLVKQDELQRKAILLLEIMGRPLMLRQMADILGYSEADISDRVAQLVNFQCVNRSATGLEEKYSVSDDVRAFTGGLIQEYGSTATDIKRQIANLSIDKRMDYSKDEFNALLVFQGFLAKRNYLPAEDFIKKQLKEHVGSVLLTLHYAKYLKEVNRRAQDAVDLLEEIRIRSGNDQQVLRLLVSYYTALEFPDFEQAHTYALEVEEIGRQDPQLDLELSRFYVSWSTALKTKPPELDPLHEIHRQQKYKELAETAIKLLQRSPVDTHEWHFLMSQAYFDLWDYNQALHHIDKALSKLPKYSHFSNPYERLRKEILKKQAMYRRSAYGTWAS